MARKRHRCRKSKARRQNDDRVLNVNEGNAQEEDEAIDRSSDAYQRNAWCQLRTSIYVLINMANTINVGTVKNELLKLNILRGKGLFCKFITEAQIASTKDTRVYATLVAVINLVFPDVGKLLLMRCVKRFRTVYCRTDKKYKCLASVIFIAHLINHGVADETLAIELLALFLESAQNEISIETAIVILEICGNKVSQVHEKRMDAILDVMQNISLDDQLHEKIKNKIKNVLKLHENGFKVKQLDLVPTDDCQITHYISLDSDIDTLDEIDQYQYDPYYEENEKNYKFLKMDLSQESETEDESSFEHDTNHDVKNGNFHKVEIKFNKQMNNSEIYLNKVSLKKNCLRNGINITVDFSLDFNENSHKLMKFSQDMEHFPTFLNRCYEQKTLKGK